jgi:hypothetical protein
MLWIVAGQASVLVIQQNRHCMSYALGMILRLDALLIFSVASISGS